MGVYNPPPASGGGGAATITELDADPGSPTSQQAWVLHSTAGGIADGIPIGMLLALTYTGNSGSSSYQLSYQTIEGAIVRTALT